MDLQTLKKQLDEAHQTAMTRTAILLGPEDLLQKAIESLLAARNCQVIKILNNRDGEVLVNEMKKVKPDLLIVNQGQCIDGFSSWMELIEDCPKLKIITINSRNNLMQVYSKQTVCIKEASDLLSIVNEGSDTTPEGGDNQHPESHSFAIHQ